MSDTSLASLNSYSDEEEIPTPKVRRPRVIRERANPFNMYDNVDFKSRYRFSKEAVMDLLQIFGAQLEPTSLRNHPVTSMNQLLIALRFYATGTFQSVIGDTFNINKSTVCRIVARVTHEIAQLRPQYIKMPQGQVEMSAVALQFYEIRGFPGVIGALDCTHVKIQSPGREAGETYRNRKGYFSINVQAVCDASLKIQDIVARWPGSVHDSTIFNDSPLKVDLETGEYENYYLLGDNGYPCKKYVLTPFLNPHTDGEKAYNKAQISTRNTIERCFGVLKRRFPCLALGMRVKLETTVAVIVACAVLHNIALSLKDVLPEEEDVPEEAEAEPVTGEQLHQDTSVRTALVNTVFSRR